MPESTPRSQPDVVQVLTTVERRESAAELALAAVDARLAACAQVSGPVTSSYRWQGRVEVAEEWQVAFKTTAAAAPGLTGWLRARHGYDVPEILWLPVLGGDPDYLAWVASEVTPSPPSTPPAHPAEVESPPPAAGPGPARHRPG